MGDPSRSSYRPYHVCSFSSKIELGSPFQVAHAFALNLESLASSYSFIKCVEPRDEWAIVNFYIRYKEIGACLKNVLDHAHLYSIIKPLLFICLSILRPAIND